MLRHVAVLTTLAIATASAADPPKHFTFPVRNAFEFIGIGLHALRHTNKDDTLIFLEAVKDDAKDAAFHTQCKEGVAWENPTERPAYCYRGVFVTVKNGGRDVGHVHRTDPLYYAWSDDLVQRLGERLPYTHVKNLAAANDILLGLKATRSEGGSVRPALLKSRTELVLDAAANETIAPSELVTNGDAPTCLYAVRPHVHRMALPEQQVIVSKILLQTCDAACQGIKCTFAFPRFISGDNAIYRITPLAAK